MSTFSDEFERELLHNIDKHLENRLELAKEQDNKLDLITRSEVVDELGITSGTLERWERLGLKRYQPPLERAKRVYYRKSDIYDFLTVDS